MIIDFADKESTWPIGEAVSLVAEFPNEVSLLYKLGNWSIQHGWNAMIEEGGLSEGKSNPKKLWLIPKAAKAQTT